MINFLFRIKMFFSADNEVFYINGTDALPPPLSKAEEEAVLRRISAGDENAR